MDDNAYSVVIVAVCVIGPIWLSKYYKIKALTAGRMNANDAALMAQMTQTAQMLEQRVLSLERILDEESPSWRASHLENGGQYGRQAG